MSMSRSRTPRSRSPSGSPGRDGAVNGTGNGDGKPSGPGEFRVVVVSGLTKNVHRGHLEEIFGVYGRVTGVDLPLFRVCKSITYFSPRVSCEVFKKELFRGGSLS